MNVLMDIVADTRVAVARRAAAVPLPRSLRPASSGEPVRTQSATSGVRWRRPGSR